MARMHGYNNNGKLSRTRNELDWKDGCESRGCTRIWTEKSISDWKID